MPLLWLIHSLILLVIMTVVSHVDILDLDITGIIVLGESIEVSIDVVSGISVISALSSFSVLLQSVVDSEKYFLHIFHFSVLSVDNIV